MDLSQSLTSRRTLRAQPRSMLRLRKRDSAPTLWEIDISLSFRTTMRRPAHVARLVQPFKGQPSGEGAVSDDREHVVFLSRQIPRHRHAESRGNGRRGMSDAEMIKRAFFDFRENR